jgi:Uncharacterized alpha/beta hydrolase domain (DUF2235)
VLRTNLKFDLQELADLSERGHALKGALLARSQGPNSLGEVVPKNIVLCLDGTGNQLKATANSNVINLYSMLDLSDPEKQVAFCDPGSVPRQPAALGPPGVKAHQAARPRLWVRDQRQPGGGLSSI